MMIATLKKQERRRKRRKGRDLSKEIEHFRGFIPKKLEEHFDSHSGIFGS